MKRHHHRVPSGRLLCVLLLSCCGWAAESPRTVPAEVAALLTALSDVAPAEVITRIDAAAAEQRAHPLVLLSRAQARWRLAQEAVSSSTASSADTRSLITAAEADFTASLRADASLRQAHLGLAQCAAARDDWPTAAREAGLGIDLATADRGQFAFLATAALRARDWRVATVAAQQGLLRFHDDASLRRIELAVLAEAGRAEDARQAALALLAQSPQEVQLWRYLAAANQQTGREAESLAALEATLLLTPDDRALRRVVADTQLNRGQPQAALHTVRPLIGSPPSAAACADDGLILMASRAAAEGGGDAGIAEARAWLAAVPEAQRSRAQRIQAARLAVQAGDAAAAGEALDALVVAGEHDAAVLTWAASLAQQRGDASRAETLYLRASASDTPSAGPATLRLAALYLSQRRRDEARTLLASYLAKQPDDGQAKALLTRLDAPR